ncbi:MAG: patatin-like phospholipase family protein [Bdellovibrio sp.]|jgi:predicted acylesterase/phospholipase RssA
MFSQNLWDTQDPMGIRLRKKKKIALVLSGGGIKAAAFHIGVCLALKEKGFAFAGGAKGQVRRNFPEDGPMTIRLYVGSSAGAFVSSILAAGYSLEALINAFDVGSGSNPRFQDKNSLGNLKPIRYRDIFSVNGRGIFGSIPSVLLAKSMMSGGVEALLKDKFKVSGLFTTKALEKYLRNYALSHNEFRQLGVELFIIGTQLNHTRKVIFGDFPETTKTSTLKFVNYATISQAVAASTSLPPVFAPYGVKAPNGKEMHFFDGEIRDTLSTHVAADHGADLVISSYSVQPYHYTPEIGSLNQFGIPVILNQALYQVIEQKINRHIQHMNDTRAIYNAIDAYFKEHKLGEEHRAQVLKIFRDRVNYKPNVDYIYINPKAQNHEMFFADHFNLNPFVLERIVRIGFRSGISALRAHDL